MHTIETLRPTILAHAIRSPKDDANLMSALELWTERFSSLASGIFLSTRHSYANSPNASRYLGSASKKMYEFVRFQLGIPFLTAAYRIGCEQSTRNAHHASLGAMVSRIFHPNQSGALYIPVMECLREAQGPQ